VVNLYIVCQLQICRKRCFVSMSVKRRYSKHFSAVQFNDDFRSFRHLPSLLIEWSIMLLTRLHDVTRSVVTTRVSVDFNRQ
jgi:hypothetical protein